MGNKMHPSRPRRHCLFTSLIMILEMKKVVQSYTDCREGNVGGFKVQKVPKCSK